MILTMEEKRAEKAVNKGIEASMSVKEMFRLLFFSYRDGVSAEEVPRPPFNSPIKQAP